MKAEPTTLSPRVLIWGPALLMTPICWVVGAVSLMASQRETFLRAAVLASIGAIGGLLLWLIYRVASRRRDGLAIFLMGMVAVTVPQKHGSLWCELGGYVFQFVLMAPMMYAIGLFSRQRKKPNPLSNADADLV